MKNNYLFCLRDEEQDKQCGIWSLDTNLEPGEIISKCRVLFSRLSSRWTVYIMPSRTRAAIITGRSPISIIKKIIDVIKHNEEAKSTTILLPAHKPSEWNKDDERRKRLEQ